MRAFNRIVKPRVTPNNGPVPKLKLNFLTGTLDPRITFSRTSNATVTGSNGLIQYAPNNLLRYSEQFDNAAWPKQFGSITATNVTAPDGTSTADVFTPVAQFGNVQQSLSPNITSGSVTLSVWLRVASGTRNIFIRASSSALLYATSVTVTSTWTRFSSTFTYDGTNPMSEVVIQDRSTTDFVPIEIWGAQLELGSTATAYNPTTAAAYYGPRFDYDGSALTYTEQLGSELVTNGDFSQGTTGWTLGNGWSIAGGVATANTTLGNERLTAVANWAGQNGKIYLVTATVTMLATPNAIATVGINVGGTGQNIFINTQASLQSGNTYTLRGFAAPTSVSPGAFQINVGSGQGFNYALNYTIDNISVKEYLGLTASGTATPKGLLIEEQRTNLLTYSEDFSNAAWIKNGMTVTPNTTIAPNGTATADTFTATAGTAFHYVRLNTASTISGSNTFSFYVKKNTSAWIFFTLNDASVNYFNLDTGAFGTTPDACTAQSLADGWYRITVTRTDTLAQCGVGVAGSNGGASFTAAGTESIYVWGAQLEAGAFATSYIPTVAAQVTRAADNVTMTGTNFSSWFNQTEGTVYADADWYTFNSARIFSAYESTGGVRLFDVYTNTPSTVVYYKNTDNTQVPIRNGLTLNTPTKIALAYKFNDYNSAVGGVLGGADTATGALVAVNVFGIGSWFNQPTSYLSGHIRAINYYPTRLSNAQLQKLTK